MTLTIANGHVLINGKLERKNVVIEEGKIIGIGSGSSGETINAEGKIILPGLIDIHVHLRDPGYTHKEDFRTGTMAAAAGGVTTVLDMPSNMPPITTVKLLQEKRVAVREKAVVNYGLYMAAADNVEETKKARNVAGVKLYYGATTAMKRTSKEEIAKHFSSGRRIVVHAEDDDMIERNAEKYKSENDPSIHAKIHSSETETAAVNDCIKIAKSGANAKMLHFTHTSTAGSIKAIKKAKDSIPISCDVTPHHLFLTSDELKKQGNFAKMNPALRSKEDVNALWKAINDGTVDCIATDHAPHTKEEKEADYWEAPSGVPGLETMLPLLLDAVNKGRMTLQQLARLTSENPARLFGIKNKGRIAIGADADLVIVDMNKEEKVKNEELFTKCKWSPFNGWKLKGRPVTTIVKGNIVYDDGEINGINGTEVRFQ